MVASSCARPSTLERRSSARGRDPPLGPSCRSGRNCLPLAGGAGPAGRNPSTSRDISEDVGWSFRAPEHLHVRGDQLRGLAPRYTPRGTPPRTWRCSDLLPQQVDPPVLLSTDVEVFRRRVDGVSTDVAGATASTGQGRTAFRRSIGEPGVWWSYSGPSKFPTFRNRKKAGQVPSGGNNSVRLKSGRSQQRVTARRHRNRWDAPGRSCIPPRTWSAFPA